MHPTPMMRAFARRAATRFTTQLVGLFAALALLLAAIGVYGLVAGDAAARRSGRWCGPRPC